MTRQRKDCEALADRKGWTVADVLIENETSAFSGKARPQYEALTEGIKNRTYDAVIAWHPDRLHRSPRELEDFIDLIEREGATVATVTAGDYDLSTPDGRLMARIVGSVARKESEDKSRRLRRKHEELAEAGKANGGGRPFGFEADRVTHRPDEAARIREAAARVIGGDSLYAIAQDWTDQGVRTVTGAPWSTTALKAFLTRARVAGKREHRGTLTDAVWAPILDESTWKRVTAILTDPSRRQAPRRRYLLTGGLAVCGICGEGLKAAPRHGGARAYACIKERDGCGGVSMLAGPIEEVVTAAVLDALDGPALAKAVESSHGEEDTDLSDAVAADEARLEELADLFADGEITRAEWLRTRDRVAARLKEARSVLASSAPNPLAGITGALTDAWEGLSIDRRRAVIGSVVDVVKVKPATGPRNRVDLDRVSIVWRA